MLDSATKQVAKPILCDTYTLIHIKQGSHIAFPNNLRELHKIKQYTVMTTRLTLLLSQGIRHLHFMTILKSFYCPVMAHMYTSPWVEAIPFI